MNFASKLSQADTSLLKNARRLFLETLPFLARYILGGEHQDGNIPPLRMNVQLLQEAKTIHFGHQKIEQDQLGPLPRNLLQCFPAVLSLNDRPTAPLERRPEPRPRIWDRHQPPAPDALAARPGIAQPPLSGDPIAAAS